MSDPSSASLISTASLDGLSGRILGGGGGARINAGTGGDSDPDISNTVEKKKPNYNCIEQKLKYDFGYVQFCKTIRFLLFF